MIEILATIAIVLITLVALGIALGDQSKGWESPRARKERHEEAQGFFYSGVTAVFLLLSFPHWRRGWVRLGVSEAWSWPIAIFGLLVIAAICLFLFATYFELERWWSKLLSCGIAALAMFGWGLVIAGPEKMPQILLEMGIGVIQRL